VSFALPPVSNAGQSGPSRDRCSPRVQCVHRRRPLPGQPLVFPSLRQAQSVEPQTLRPSDPQILYDSTIIITAAGHVAHQQSHPVDFAAALVASRAPSSRYYATPASPFAPSIICLPATSRLASPRRSKPYWHPRDTSPTRKTASANVLSTRDAFLTCRSRLGPPATRQNGLPGIFIPTLPGLAHGFHRALAACDAHQSRFPL
jgi:hypothetical protein